MCTNNEQKLEQPVEAPAPAYKQVCGYCGSTELPIPYEQMYGPGAFGYDCCPNCGGV